MFLTPSSTPCWTIERSPKIKKRAPRCMGTLRQKTERAPRCMGTLFVLSWSSWVPPRAPQAIAPNIHFQVSFCDFCSSGSTWWPLPARTQVENMQYHIGFINVFDALIDSMLGHRTVTKNKKRAPRCMGTLRQKTDRAPRCMGTLFVFSWSSWVPPSSPGDCTKH